jgi:demethylmenaquinone methyltransferase / 2-methoxy-6-polyprenyl-1,4-benzoquinol methylase
VSGVVSKGTTPAGAHDEREAAAWVRGMFGRVAHRYDFLNHLLSFNMDRYWRAYTVRRVRHILERPGARVLDLCCGTGDLALALERRSRSVVLGCDFCHPMLVSARGKVEQLDARVALFESDVLHLPVRDGSMDLVTVAFGFRNLANYEAGLAEMRRVLRPGGTVAILEFSQPPNAVFRAMNNLYCSRILPWIGGLVSGALDAYSYLPESVRKFPAAPELAVGMRRAGFEGVSYDYLTGGAVALHLGEARDGPAGSGAEFTIV